MFFFVAILIIIGVIILIAVVVALLSGRCSECGKFMAMKAIDATLIEKVPTTLQEKRTKKNKEGKVISTWTVDVPATRFVYRVKLKCKYCNNITIKHRIIVRKN